MNKKASGKSIKARTKSPGPSELTGDFESLVASILQIHHQAQDFATKAVNVGLTLRNWFIGHRIVEFEQLGADRAAYGERLLPALAKRLAAAGLKRVDTRELRRFRLLYTLYPQIRESLSPELLARAGGSPSVASTPLSASQTAPSIPTPARRYGPLPSRVGEAARPNRRNARAVESASMEALKRS